MQLYRICQAQYLEGYSGFGANYLPSPRPVPASYRQGIYKHSGRATVDTWAVEDFPAKWNEYPYPAATQRLGAAWLRSGTRVALRVPSAAVPGGLEQCVVIKSLGLPTKSLASF